MAEISKTGVFFDTKENKVVDSPPAEGVQIVAPGHELTQTAKEDIERYRAIERGDVVEVETVGTTTISTSATEATETTETSPKAKKST